MSLFTFFSKKPSFPINLSVLQVDIHSHLLPGIDDGAPTLDHSIGMLRRFEELGYKKLIITPHIMSGVYDNTSAVILEKLEEVKVAAKQAGIPLQLEASAEYYLDETLLERVRTNDLLPFHGNHILFECSFRSESQHVDTLIFQLLSKGYQPVIAHFERYVYYHNRIKEAQRLRDNGVYIQLNINSLTGHYGPAVKKQAVLLVKNKLVDIVGSDCHRIEHLNLLEKHLSDQEMHDLMELELKNSSFL